MAGLRDKLPLLLGAKTAKALATSLDIETVSDLLRHYPRRYAERGELTDIAGLELGEHATVLARIEKVSKRRMKARNGTIIDMVITDGKRRLTCAFFNQAWREKDLVPGKTGLFAGKVSAFRDTLQLTNPEYELFDAENEAEAMDNFLAAIIPVYPAAQGMPTWSIAKCVRQVLDVLEVDDDPMPAELRRLHKLSDLDNALRGIHRPENWAHLEASKKRLKWDEAMAVQLIFAQRRHSAISRPAKANPHVSGGLMEAFDKRLPFDLTAGQRGIGDEIAADLASEHPMNRLLQGEVGSGKTVVALRAMLQVVDNGRQAAMLAPTEVLAAQHARSLREMLGDLGQAGELGAAENATRVTLLTGSMGAKERKKALLEIVSGEAGIVVGTHALIQDHVEFADLGLAVVDEQHRFGVEQRDALRTRGAGDTSPHVLVMTATPIPRTVAMTVYGDLEVSALREMPVGRSPIATTVVPVAEKPAWFERIWQRVREEVGKGHQAYVVCPRIGDEPPSDKSDKRPPLAVLEVAPELAHGPLQGLKIDVLHGRMPPDGKDAVMRAFSAGELDVLVATTVIEVGVNVPNATAMVIMDADRFGVSQLHQLRGRVGRGSVPGLCLLVTETLDGTATRERLAAVESTTDGFELSRLDLELRREGDILGAAQSGKRSTLKLLSLLRDEDVIAASRALAQELVTQDPELTKYRGLAQMVADVVDVERAEYLEKS
ncbi:ATP-dependent DNA helicase RecG [Amycolatopsis mediterranei S699]|uniref:ATP-dependent DNA helicase RecG n=3 Tax=Amycolatopsis mediterranei TaxID=33910 RepID=A0A0H3D041_AMYMU|nr:ATP-dependent DNA helicase RecG [Amycolatopsis mediterranei]ADJ43564.1 ATP-dependent DNA helicase RecG [Amycolatopsis mediterranei U32]AEK40270.1 ATP-dependent DNA helicase RecG [Amycolatopsis mediterranei S699]AFO75276.1 ATP-dependent DNA helicase RecG [Amycolatopsis mediterranei S699]AGT82405.1 ATP-dependent DNA helicase RecG [Amycolatopsis mediterranei RB]KDO03763.1 ATP-dependent DNA helicase RecG [Amycolatopsis mediterranei]